MDNSDRAKAAFSALNHFSELVGVTCEDKPTQLKDLLTDLFHLCDRAGMDMLQVFESARGMYHQERAEDDEGDWPVLQQVPFEEWAAQRADICPCDNHPAEKCETCEGACSCHWKQNPWPVLQRNATGIKANEFVILGKTTGSLELGKITVNWDNFSKALGLKKADTK